MGGYYVIYIPRLQRLNIYFDGHLDENNMVRHTILWLNHMFATINLISLSNFSQCISCFIINNSSNLWTCIHVTSYTMHICSIYCHSSIIKQIPSVTIVWVKKRFYKNVFHHFKVIKHSWFKVKVEWLNQQEKNHLYKCI